jgi:predicted DNA-binding ArsR family transcriptional regulator
MIEDTYKTYRKIAIRFLKDTGLYPYWRGYVKSGEINRFLRNHYSKKWYTKPKIENIFGETNFSNYLLENNVKLEHTVFEYFLIYLKEYHPEIMHEQYSSFVKTRLKVLVTAEELIKTFPLLEK